MTGESKGKVRVFDDVGQTSSGAPDNDYSLNNSLKLPFQETLGKFLKSLSFETKVVIASIILGFFATVADAMVDYLFFYNLTLSEIFFTSIPAEEFYNRFLLFLTYTGFGFLASRMLTGYKNAEDNLRRMNEDLEARVLRRTEKLIKANNKFQIEAVEKSKIEQALRYRVEFIDIITRFSTKFISVGLDEIDDTIIEMLHKVSIFEEVERSYIYIVDEEDDGFNLSYHWLDDDTNVKRNYKVNFGSMKYVNNMIVEKGAFQLKTPDMLPKEAVEEKVLFNNPDHKSIILIPLFVESKTIGYLGFESYTSERKWSETTVNMLSLVSQMFVNVLKRKRDHEKLTATEAKYKKLFNEVPVGLYSTTPEGKLLEANKAIVKMLGYENKDELMKDQVEDMYFDRVEREVFIKQLQKKGIIYNYKLRLRTKTGEMLDVFDTSRVVKDDNGNIVAFEGNMRPANDLFEN